MSRPMRSGPYPARPIIELVPEISQQEFIGGSTGWWRALDRGVVSLPRVECWLSSADADGSPELHRVAPESMPIQRPVGMPDNGPGLRRDLPYPPCLISRLPGAICIPGGMAIWDGHILAESFSARWEMYQHRHASLADDGWHVPALDGFDTGNLPVIDEPVLFLDHQHIDWFGHVLLDLLAPAWAHEMCLAYLQMSRLRVLCSKPRYAFVDKLLNAAGIPAKSVVFIDRPVRCRELVVATKAFQIQEYVSPPSTRLWRSMRERVTGRSSPPGALRVYVSRALNPTRRLVEERAIEALFLNRGFTIIHPEEYDVFDQIGIFSGATLIAGCSGSNIFNLAFQKNARAVLVLVSPLLVHYTEQLLQSTQALLPVLDAWVC